MSATPNEAAIITLVAETHIHPGIGQSTGALDLPVARERTTQYPFIPGSGVKGAYRVWAKERAGLVECVVNELFGPKDQASSDEGDGLKAGMLLCSDARLLLLPVRCLSDAFKWVTCPAILKRFKRDCERAGPDCGLPKDIAVAEGQYRGADTQDPTLGLEEREFNKATAQIGQNIIDALSPIVGETELKQRLVILSDKDFTWFARYALPVMARNDLDANKISKNLWYEETLSPDTIMYVLLGERPNNGNTSKAVKTITDAAKNGARYIQMGGNETIGQGWFRMVNYGGGG